MIKGIRFEISSDSKKSFFEIFATQAIEEYHWHIIHDQTEVWDSSFENNFFKSDVYIGSDLKRFIQNDQLVIFVKMQAYCTPTLPINISTFEEFIKSDCCLILLLYDCKYVEIYSKNEQISKDLFRTAILNNFINVDYITRENDQRTSLDII